MNFSRKHSPGNWGLSRTRAIALLEEDIALYKGPGDDSGAAFVLGNLGHAVLHGGYRKRVPPFVEEAEALMQGDLDGHTRAFLRMTVGSAAMEQGDLESAVSQLEENLILCRELDDLRNTSMSLFVLGMAEIRPGLSAVPASRIGARDAPISVY
jgi:hypothetical protein